MTEIGSERRQVLRSIDDAFALIGVPCNNCDETGWGGRYSLINLEGGYAVYGCDMCYDTRRLLVDFRVTPEQIKCLEIDVQSFLSSSPISLAGLSVKDIREISRRADNIMHKIHTYATFAPPDLNIQIEGFCQYCHDQVPVRIDKNRVWVTCPPCASLIAECSSG